MDTEGVRADRRTIGEDYVPLGRQSNTTSPRGLEESGKAILSKGSKGEEVIQLQEILKEKGLYKGKIDGVYGDQTKKAVIEFQKYINTAPDFFGGYWNKQQHNSIGAGHKKVGVDGIVGDETRQALMYKEPEARVQFPMGESTNRKFQVTDNRVMGESVNMDYVGGTALLGLMALPGLAAEGLAAGAANTQIVPNVINSMGRMLPQARNILNPIIPRGLPSTGGRFFPPQTPSAFGSRIGYNNGGPIDSLYQPTVTNNMLQSNVTPSVIQPNVIQKALNPTAAQAVKSLGGGGTSSHSKSKERFREKSMGGDVSLSNTSFEVNGNPNTIDGNFYPQLNAKLDHGEVVKNNFVFSNRLRDTKTNKTFAKLALPIEKATGNAQKLLRVNPADPFAKNTLSRNEQAIQSLTMTQENLASAAGLRGNSRGYATGGYMQGDDPIYMEVQGN